MCAIWLDVVIDRGRNSTVRDVARKVMGDIPIAYIEGIGGTRVAETDPVEVGKNDVGLTPPSLLSPVIMSKASLMLKLADINLQDWESLIWTTLPRLWRCSMFTCLVPVYGL